MVSLTFWVEQQVHVFCAVMIVIENTEVVLRVVILGPLFQVLVDLVAYRLVQEAQLFVQIFFTACTCHLLHVLLMRQLAFEAQRNVFVFTGLDVAELHCTLKVDILPERALVAQVRLVESEVVVRQQAL